MRRLSVLPVVLSLLLGLPGVAAAAPPDRFSDERTSLFCDLVAPDGSTIFLSADVSEQFGSFAGLAIWAPGSEPFAAEPIAVSGDAEVSLSEDGSLLTASLQIWTFDPTAEPPFGDLLGTAELTATLTPVGEPMEFEDEFKEGNRLIRSSGVRQALMVAGELVLPDGTVVPLDDCFAEHVIETFFATNPAQPPASFVFRSEVVTLSCSWETDGGFVDLFATSDEFGAFSDLFIATGETFVFGFSEDTVLTTETYSATFTITDPEGGPVGSASASASLTPTGERFRLVDRFVDGSFKLIGELISVDGTLEVQLDGGMTLTMDDEQCFAVDGRTMSHFVDPRGPKGRPLANDAAEGAIPLAIGQTDRVITGGNALEPEEPCVGGIDPETGEPFEFPITYTAWWTFTGTGEEVTVSTEGSDFDTIVGIYVLEEGELVQVACVDDVFEPEFSLLAEVTIATEAGETYYIQAGGFAEASGRLVVSVE